MIVAVERATEVADGSPCSGHSQVGCEAVDAVGDGLQGGRIRDGGQGVAGVAGRVAVQVGLRRVGEDVAVVGIIAGAVAVGVQVFSRIVGEGVGIITDAIAVGIGPFRRVCGEGIASVAVVIVVSVTLP